MNSIIMKYSISFKKKYILIRDNEVDLKQEQKK